MNGQGVVGRSNPYAAADSGDFTLVFVAAHESRYSTSGSTIRVGMAKSISYGCSPCDVRRPTRSGAGCAGGAPVVTASGEADAWRSVRKPPLASRSRSRRDLHGGRSGRCPFRAQSTLGFHWTPPDHLQRVPARAMNRRAFARESAHWQKPRTRGDEACCVRASRDAGRGVDGTSRMHPRVAKPRSRQGRVCAAASGTGGRERGRTGH